jgi:hypothetical protein
MALLAENLVQQSELIPASRRKKPVAVADAGFAGGQIIDRNAMRTAVTAQIVADNGSEGPWRVAPGGNLPTDGPGALPMGIDDRPARVGRENGGRGLAEGVTKSRQSYGRDRDYRANESYQEMLGPGGIGSWDGSALWCLRRTPRGL